MSLLLLYVLLAQPRLLRAGQTMKEIEPAFETSEEIEQGSVSQLVH